MLNLDKLSKGNLEKIEKVLTIILEAVEFRATNEGSVLIPKTKFKNRGLSISEVTAIIDKIEKEENKLVRNIQYIRPLKPNRFSSTYSTLFGYEEAISQYEWQKREYEEKYEENLEINIKDVKKVKNLLQRIVEKQNWLVCNGLKFNIQNGEAMYKKKGATIFKPETKEYKLLKALMEKPNERLSYDKIGEILYSRKKEIGKTSGRDISFVVRNVKRKLKITDKKELFVACNGYKIVCNSKG